MKALASYNGSSPLGQARSSVFASTLEGKTLAVFVAERVAGSSMYAYHKRWACFEIEHGTACNKIGTARGFRRFYQRIAVEARELPFSQLCRSCRWTAAISARFVTRQKVWLINNKGLRPVYKSLRTRLVSVEQTMAINGNPREARSSLLAGQLPRALSPPAPPSPSPGGAAPVVQVASTMENTNLSKKSQGISMISCKEKKSVAQSEVERSMVGG